MADFGGWLDAFLASAGVAPQTGFVELSGGTYNTVLRVTTGDGPVVVKVAPDPARPAMSYETGIMATEALYYRLAASAGITSVPRVIFHGWVDERFGGREALVLTLRPGHPWPQVAPDLDESERHALRAAVGREIAALHRITSPGFGYPAGPLAASWREAFTAMIDAVLTDASRFGVELPRKARSIATIVSRVGAVLDEVDVPALVHFDLWDGNILVYGRMLGGLIDAERAFFGDPLAEFISLRLYAEDLDEPLLEGYRAAGGSLQLDDAARLRLTLYRLYLYLIMWVETAPRGYDDGHVAWLREKVFRPTAAMLDTLRRSAG